MVTIEPDVRELFAETIAYIVLTAVALLGVNYFIGDFGQVTNIVVSVILLIFLIIFAMTYIRLRCISWQITSEVICRTQGIFIRQKDYIELYRVVDYAEQQSFLQRLFGVKTVTIYSTDRSDAVMLIIGVPYKQDLITYIRTIVEQCKQEKRIYEITNN